MTEDEYIDHEVRIRELEAIYEKITNRLNLMSALLGGIFTSIIIPVLLHSMKLL